MIQNTSIGDIERIYKAQKAFFESGATRSYSYRKEQLQKLKKAMKAREADILQALHKDLHKHSFEAFTSEVGLVYEEINHTLAHLQRWMEPERIDTSIVHFPTGSKLYKDPLGLSLIIGPWNYPFMIVILPLVGAIAGGNCCIVKPSHNTPHTAKITEELIAATFPEEYVAVVQGPGSMVGPQLIESFRFDHIFFTGSAAVGKQIMGMAAKTLTPVTLELGGKSPCIIDTKVNLDVAAKRIIWGKFWNTGQTCVAPDYVLIPPALKDEFIQLAKKYLLAFFGEDAQKSDSYGRIVNSKRFDTLCTYLKEGDLLYGGKTDAGERYIEPTLLGNVSLDSAIMKEEVFGPILPILTYSSREEAVHIIARNPYPLAFYLFSSNKDSEKYYIDKIRFGGGCINNALIHFANPDLPLGGVGYSGMGRYHGTSSFDTFTHAKSVMKTSQLFDIPLRFPPFSELKLKLAKFFFR